MVETSSSQDNSCPPSEAQSTIAFDIRCPFSALRIASLSTPCTRWPSWPLPPCSHPWQQPIYMKDADSGDREWARGSWANLAFFLTAMTGAGKEEARAATWENCCSHTWRLASPR